MQQKLAVVSVLTLLLLAGAGSVLVATHAFDQNSSPNIKVLPGTFANTPSSKTASPDTNSTIVTSTSTSTTAITGTSIITSTTSTNSTSPATNSGASNGSLLLSNPPQSASHGDDGDESDDGGRTLGGNATSVHASGDD